MYDKFAVLSLMVVVVVSVSLGMKEDVAHGTPVKHGMKHGGQDSLKKDGSWNVHFDHAAIISMNFCSYIHVHVIKHTFSQ